MLYLGREDLSWKELLGLGGIEAGLAAAAGAVAVASAESHSLLGWAVGATLLGVLAATSCVNDLILAATGGVECPRG